MPRFYPAALDTTPPSRVRSWIATMSGGPAPNIYNLGNNPSTTVSTLSLDVIQPLLRGAGWAVTLEPLTQAERNLLYAVRDFARFRHPDAARKLHLAFWRRNILTPTGRDHSPGEFFGPGDRCLG